MTAAVVRLAEERPWVVAAALVLLHATVGWLAFDPGPHVGGDNTAYLTLARSLLDHGRYMELWDPARPPHTQYPPGFPAILAVAWTLGLRSWMGMKLMMLGFSAAAVGLSYLWMQARTSATVAAGLGLILAVAPGLAAETQWVLSDVPFWAVTMGALLALERGRVGWGIALAFVALTLRTAGLPLIVALAVWLGLRGRWRSALATTAALVGLWLLWTLRAPAMETHYVSLFWLENPYVPELGRAGVLELMDRILGNAGRYGFRILMRTLAGVTSWPAAVSGVLLSAAAAVGFAMRLLGRRDGGDGDAAAQLGPVRVSVVEPFAVLYVGMLLLWPEPWASDRFLFPFLPVLLVYAAEGVSALPGPEIRGFIRMATAALILGFAIPPSVKLWSTAADCRAAVRQWGLFACMAPEQRAFLELAEWSSGQLPDDAVVISRKPRQWYWFSGYPGEVYPYSLDRTAVLEQARRLGARYVVLDELGPTGETYLMPAVLELRRRFCVVRRRQDPTGASAALLGVMPTPWEPEALGIDEEPSADGPRLPLCPAAYRGEAGTGVTDRSRPGTAPDASGDASG